MFRLGIASEAELDEMDSLESPNCSIVSQERTLRNTMAVGKPLPALEIDAQGLGCRKMPQEDEDVEARRWRYEEARNKAWNDIQPQ